MQATVNQRTLPEVDGLRGRLGYWLRVDAARLLWPTACQVCRAPGGEALDLCEACARALPWSAPGALACPPGLDAAHAALDYHAPVDRLVPRLKFHRDLAAGLLLSQLVVQAAGAWPRPQALVPVPLHPGRLRTRGYDQALELARPVARALGLPLRADRLRRVRATAAQSTLDAHDRHANLAQAFAVGPGAPLPAHVALFDDVLTTGATLAAAASALRRAGVARVDAWVCARVP